MLLSAAAGAALSACATPSGGGAEPAAPSAAEAERLNAFFEESFKKSLARSPMFATSIGDRLGYDRWDDLSDAAAKAEVDIQLADVATMRRDFDFKALDEQTQLSWRLFELRAQRAREALAWRGHGYQFTNMGGPHTGAPVFLINNHRVESVADAEAYVARIAGMRAYLAQAVDLSQASAARGIAPPKHIYDYVLPAARNVITGAPFDSSGRDSPLWADVKTKVGRLDADDATKTRLLTEAERALLGSVKPAYEAMIPALEAQQAKAGTDDGVWRLPDGDAYYAFMLERMTTTKLSAAEIHEIGLENVARIHDEMRAIMKAVKFEGDLKAFFTFLEEDPRFFLPQTPEGKAEYIRRATEAIDAMRTRVPDYFNIMPRAPMEVRAVEPFRERSAGLAFYQRPSADGSRPGYYYANTVDMKALPTYQIEALAFHEGIPGHHFQIALQQELEGIPRFRRLLLAFTAYAEGWGLYTEKLAKEMGFYTDPYSDFGRLALEVRRAIRLVVDTGLHAKRWPRERAVQYVLDNQPGDRAQAERDIDRYIVMPGQATAYMIGQIELFRLRDEAKRAMGGRFDIKGFHDVVLAGGAVPLDVLGARVRAWAAA